MKQSDLMRRKGQKQTVLIVEDNELNREMLSAILSDDFIVIEASDGVEGLEQLAARYTNLALVLLDVYMPRCDGFEFLRRKREDSRYDAVPVIVTTISGAIEDEKRCLELGANDFIVKPYDADIIRNRIANMVHLRNSASIVNRLTWDANTRLYNKEFFYRAVEEVFAESGDAAYDLLCSDIENFKALNDRYGEPMCDRLLRDLAMRLVDSLPGMVVGGRLGGDTFAFLLKRHEPGWETLLAAVTDGMPYASLNVVYGIVPNVDKSMAVPVMCNQAISALETVKGRGNGTVAWLDEALHQRLVIEQTIRESMGEALRQRQFSVHLQPKHDVRTNRVGGAEALVRWMHPTLGFVSPAVFVPIFERNGFITKLDLYVWDEACRVIRYLEEKGLSHVPISVNASRMDFDDPNLAEKIAQIADSYGVDRSLLHIELTETAYSDNPEGVKTTLGKLKEMGFETELDDFGSGFSALTSLNTLPLDIMKLDMSMVHQATALNDFRIVEAAINLAQVLGLKTVVEGVETAEEARRVSDIGCDLIQGYYFSRPLPLEEFEAYLLHDQQKIED